MLYDCAIQLMRAQRDFPEKNKHVKDDQHPINDRKPRGWDGIFNWKHNMYEAIATEFVARKSKNSSA
jgi:hypothetical protein